MIFQVIQNFNFSFSRVEFAAGSFDSILITVCKKCVFDALLGVGNCDRKYSNGFCSVRDLERVHIVIIGGDKRWTGVGIHKIQRGGTILTFILPTDLQLYAPFRPTIRHNGFLCFVNRRNSRWRRFFLPIE